MLNGLLLGVLSAPALDFSAITTAITGSINTGMIATIVGAVLASSVGFAVFWFGGRKIVNAVMSAFKSGKIKF